MSKVFLNDKLVDADKATISVDDGGFLYGAGLFETMRSVNGVVFALDDHLERLFTCAKELSINNTYDRKFIKDAIHKTLAANKLTDARLRLTLTSGSVSQDEDQPQPTLLITVAKFEPYPPEYYQNGVMVIMSPYRQNLNDPTYGRKTISYFSRILALKLAQQKKAAEAIWFTTDNRLAEGCISNVFIVKDSGLFTPTLKTPILAGIARKTVLETAEKNAIRYEEKDLHIDDLLDADEVFLTNVIMKIMPVSKIEKKVIGKGKAGTVTKEMQRYFEQVIKDTCGEKNES